MSIYHYRIERAGNLSLISIQTQTVRLLVRHVFIAVDEERMVKGGAGDRGGRRNDIDDGDG